MKKLLSAALCALFLLTPLTATAQNTVSVFKTASEVTVDGKTVPFDAYAINGNNYFKLRDIAYALADTSKRFDVQWDKEKQAINLISGQRYTVVGGELTTTSGGDEAILSGSPIYLDGKAVNLTAYTINQNNYFRLRDVAKLFDFGTLWSNITECVSIESRMEYFPESSPLNYHYISNTETTAATNWAHVSSVHQFSYRDEALAYAFVHDENNTLVIALPEKTLEVPMQYPLLGDVLADDNGNLYVIWGRTGEANTQETVFISKFTPDGLPVKTTGFVGASVMGSDGNTAIPFQSGQCTSTIGNGLLMVNYAREMYSGHQSNNVIGVHLSDLSPVVPTEIPYTSHSFNQSILWSDRAQDFIYADHGDAYDRGFVVTSSVGKKLLFHFYLQANANYDMWIVNKTWAQLGGLAETSRGVVLAGASAKSIGEAAKTESQNLFVQIFDPTAPSLSPDIFVGGAPRSGSTSLNINDNQNTPLTPVTDSGVHWLTNYTDQNVLAPQVVVADERIVLLWSTDSDTHYMVLSGDGTVLVPQTSLGGLPLNSYETPIYLNGAIQWVYAKNGILGMGYLPI